MSIIGYRQFRCARCFFRVLDRQGTLEPRFSPSPSCHAEVLNDSCPPRSTQRRTSTLVVPNMRPLTRAKVSGRIEASKSLFETGITVLSLFVKVLSEAKASESTVQSPQVITRLRVSSGQAWRRHSVIQHALMRRVCMSTSTR